MLDSLEYYTYKFIYTLVWMMVRELASCIPKTDWGELHLIAKKKMCELCLGLIKIRCLSFVPLSKRQVCGLCPRIKFISIFVYERVW